MGGTISYRRTESRTVFEVRLELAQALESGAPAPLEPWRATTELTDDEERPLNRSGR
jgi:hypothetical protein